MTASEPDWDTPTLTAHVPGPVLLALRQVLIGRLGIGRAAEVLTEVDRVAHREMAGMPDWLADDVAAASVKQAAVMRELAGTRGLAWKAWAPGYLLVTLDGERIGRITPAVTTGPPHRVRSWNPHVDGQLARRAAPLEPARTAKAAAYAIYKAKFGHHYVGPDQEGRGN
jgi:hypothetical protein